MKQTVQAQSPFLPGTNIQFALDSTSLGYIKTCPRLYQYIMIDGWSPKDESVHLRFGSEYHQAIQEYDIERAEGRTHEEAIRGATRDLLIRTADWEVDEGTKAGNYKNRRTLLQLVVDYFDYYKDDPAQTFILENGKPAVELSFKFELDWGPKTYFNAKHVIDGDDEGPITQPYLLCGHLDRVVSFNDHLFVLDHKTTTTTPSDYFFNQFEPNNQMTLYTLAGKVIIDSPIKGVIVEAAQILIDKPNRFVRGFTYRTQDQLDEWVSDLHYTLQLAEHYAEINYWPMNDTACDKYGGCKFREICSKSPQVRETFLKADFVKLEKEERWNPLKPR
jgi:PD-(D/E)XK nuclease superfamily